MSRDEQRTKVIEMLNKALSMELQAIHLYMQQHYHLDDLDFGELAANVKLISIDEMRHAESLSERITELGGEPTTDLAGPIAKGQGLKRSSPSTPMKKKKLLKLTPSGPSCAVNTATRFRPTYLRN